jgi:type VI secretion system protein ImpF
VSEPGALSQERLQPVLLDRLTDDEPHVRQEPREQRVVSKSRLRRAVLRDMAWLLNASRLEGVQDLSRVPLVRRSVVNFGLPALSGRTASSLDAVDLERAVAGAIRDYEPRILPHTLEVRAILAEHQLERHNVVGLEIRGQLWSQPVPLEMLVRTEIDLETGEVNITDVGSGAGSASGVGVGYGSGLGSGAGSGSGRSG